MKLVDILARELEEWPEGASFAWQDWDKEVRFHGRPGKSFHATQLASDNVRNYQEDNPNHGVTVGEWQAARASYLASIQPERDAEISEIVESALQIQQGGTHYKDLKIQPIEYIHANGLDFFQGNIVKYATRHKDKNGAQDLRKIIHYAQLAIELQYGEKP